MDLLVESDDNRTGGGVKQLNTHIQLLIQQQYTPRKVLYKLGTPTLCTRSALALAGLAGATAKHSNC